MINELDEGVTIQILFIKSKKSRTNYKVTN